MQLQLKTALKEVVPPAQVVPMATEAAVAAVMDLDLAVRDLLETD
jgi:hypothetical protein